MSPVIALFIFRVRFGVIPGIVISCWQTPRLPRSSSLSKRARFLEKFWQCIHPVFWCLVSQVEYRTCYSNEESKMNWHYTDAVSSRVLLQKVQYTSKKFTISHKSSPSVLRSSNSSTVFPRCYKTEAQRLLGTHVKCTCVNDVGVRALYSAVVGLYQTYVGPS